MFQFCDENVRRSVSLPLIHSKQINSAIQCHDFVMQMYFLGCHKNVMEMCSLCTFFLAPPGKHCLARQCRVDAASLTSPNGKDAAVILAAAAAAIVVAGEATIGHRPHAARACLHRDCLIFNLCPNTNFIPEFRQWPKKYHMTKVIHMTYFPA